MNRPSPRRDQAASPLALISPSRPTSYDPQDSSVPASRSAREAERPEGGKEAKLAWRHKADAKGRVEVEATKHNTTQQVEEVAEYCWLSQQVLMSWREVPEGCVVHEEG